MCRPLIFAFDDNGPFGTQRRRLWVTLLPSLQDDQRQGVFRVCSLAMTDWKRSSDPAIGAGTATGDAGEFPGRQPFLAIVDHQFGMLLAADEEAG